jgi:hypothetical protein
MTRFLLSVAVVFAAFGSTGTRAQTAVFAAFGSAGTHAQTPVFVLFSHRPSLGTSTASTRDHPFYARMPAGRLAFADTAPEPPTAPARTVRFPSEHVPAAIRGLAAAFSGVRAAEGAPTFALRPGARTTPTARRARPRPKALLETIFTKGSIDLGPGLTWKFSDGLHYRFTDHLVGTLGYGGIGDLDRAQLGFTYRF